LKEVLAEETGPSGDQDAASGEAFEELLLPFEGV
jgi:hypothetical protein